LRECVRIGRDCALRHLVEDRFQIPEGGFRWRDSVGAGERGAPAFVSLVAAALHPSASTLAGGKTAEEISVTSGRYSVFVGVRPEILDDDPGYEPQSVSRVLQNPPRPPRSGLGGSRPSTWNWLQKPVGRPYIRSNRTSPETIDRRSLKAGIRTKRGAGLGNQGFCGSAYSRFSRIMECG